MPAQEDVSGRGDGGGFDGWLSRSAKKTQRLADRLEARRRAQGRVGIGHQRDGDKARLCQFVPNEIASREGHSRCNYMGVVHLQMPPPSHLLTLHENWLPSVTGATFALPWRNST